MIRHDEPPLPAVEIDQIAVRTALEEIAGELEGIGHRLAGLHSSLPTSPREDLMLVGEEEPDFSCSVRGTIECGLTDHLRPLTLMIRAAARSGTP